MALPSSQPRETLQHSQLLSTLDHFVGRKDALREPVEGDEVLKDKINSLVLQGHKKLVLNLADVPYIDSAGLGEIVRTFTTVSRQGGSLKLLSLTKRITDLLAITKLLTVFETHDNEADAIRSFQSTNV